MGIGMEWKVLLLSLSSHLKWARPARHWSVTQCNAAELLWFYTQIGNIDPTRMRWLQRSQYCEKIPGWLLNWKLIIVYIIDIWVVTYNTCNTKQKHLSIVIYIYIRLFSLLYVCILKQHKSFRRMCNMLCRCEALTV